MPRKDRSFTADDILRLYCRNLSAFEQRIVALVGLDCGEPGDEGQRRVIGILDLLTSPPLSNAVDLLPGGNYISQALDLIYAIATGDLDVSSFEEVPGEFIYLGRDLQPFIRGRVSRR